MEEKDINEKETKIKAVENDETAETEDQVNKETESQDVKDDSLAYEKEHGSPEDEDDNETENRRITAKAVLSELFDWIEIFAVSVAIVIFVFTFVLRLAIVDGDSMNQTLINGETLVVSRLNYEPKNGDIIVFQTDYNGYTEPLVKRVIAVGGQTVDIDFENWIVYVDGVAVEEDYVNYIEGKPMRNFVEYDAQEYPLYVPEGYVFAMGDNRNDSLDSRSLRIGLIDEGMIMGKVVLRLFPIDKFGNLYN